MGRYLATRPVVDDFVKPNWTYQQIRNSVQTAYRALSNATQGSHKLRDIIEQGTPDPLYGVGVYWPSTNLRAVLEHLDALIAIAPPASEALVTLTQLKQRTNGQSAMKRWLDELTSDFDKRNNRLRRTRNALMHGGPLVRRTVDDVARFAEALAYLALGPAVDLLLADRNVIDGFLDRQQVHDRCFSQLRAGIPAAEALFWG